MTATAATTGFQVADAGRRSSGWALRGWQLVDTAMTADATGHDGEGPQIAKLNEGDPHNTADDDGYAFLVDDYAAGGYRAFVTTGTDIAASSQGNRISQQEEWEPRTAGLPDSPRHGSFVSASQQVLDAMHDWREVEAVPSQTIVSAVGRTVTAEVSADDGGDVAGTVVFSGDNWSETATLSDGHASVEVPETVGEIAATYQGYRDELVALSQSEPLEIGSAPSISATTATRCVAGRVTLTVTATPTGDEPVTASITTPFQVKSGVTLQPGRSTTAAFSTRQADIPAGDVTVEVEGTEVVASYAAASCS